MSPFGQGNVTIPLATQRRKVRRYSRFLSFLLLPTVVMVLPGCVTQDSQYIRRDIDTLQGQIDDLRKEISSIKTPASAQPEDALAARKRQADIEAELEDVKRNLNSLRATMEDNQDLTTRTFKRLDDLEKAFTTRLNDLETELEQKLVKAEEVKAPPQPVSPPSAAEPASPHEAKAPPTPEGLPITVPADAKRAYDEAYEAFKAGDLEGAKKKFLSFLKTYPDTRLSDNAQFWIGEIYFKQHQYEAAILAYEDVVKKYPSSNKLPDTLLKQGLAFLELGDKIDARIILENLTKKYPNTEQAKIAQRKLRTLK